MILDLGLVEYVALRIVRRFLLSNRFLLRFGSVLPYYAPNAGQVNAETVVDIYADAAAQARMPDKSDRVTLEIGSGISNAVGYSLAKRNWHGRNGHIYLFDPYVRLDGALDKRLRRQLPPETTGRVQRIPSLETLAPRSVDVVLSHSVLEHVRRPAELFIALDRVLAGGGLMIHVVDYRDHFFKYPYHFLLFSGSAWNRWLDPGDLPRWRLGDHRRVLARHGFEGEVIARESLVDEFQELQFAWIPRSMRTILTSR